MITFTRNFISKQMWHTRLLIALSSFTWSAFLFWGDDTFSRKTYELMAVFPQNLWATLFFIHGVFAIRSICCDENCVTKFCSKYGKKMDFIGDATLGMILWTSSTLMCFASHWPTKGTWLEQLLNYPPPAAMSGELWVAVYSWIYFIFAGADLMKGDKK